MQADVFWQILSEIIIPTANGNPGTKKGQEQKGKEREDSVWKWLIDPTPIRRQLCNVPSHASINTFGSSRIISFAHFLAAYSNTTGTMFGRMFGKKEDKALTAGEAIQKLRETEEMLMKKQEYLEKKIEQVSKYLIERSLPYV